ncbi:Alanine aminotransferase [Spironucleus salmonicida]|uniref:Alanine aminotransferase n=2 Tax=Spironucleus salmonicida TaxID=348837 RepID=V6LQ22_9EUKA|nr:Alanine aminotransferase [Spironucleus salmonicida]|eukprot:EST46343.1 Alanine aminotransferase [Spironucleus salmonicida]
MYFLIDDLNPSVIQAEYAVRGKIVAEAAQIEQQLKAGKEFPFKSIAYLNIGNPQALGMPYQTMLREFIALCMAPHILKTNTEAFNPDAVSRAKDFIKENPAGIGAYTNSLGFESVRKQVAGFIKNRDGYEAGEIFLSNGASSAIRDVIQLISGPEFHFFLPVPQYPLYSAALALNSADYVNYYLDEENQWKVTDKELKRAYAAARHQPKAIILLNPSNPTGSILTQTELLEIIEFCHQHEIAILADEVYQENIYYGEFVSVKKALKVFEETRKCQGPVVFSFHSVSKGYLGECGLRGGFMEVVNGSKGLMENLRKLASISLCSNTTGQLAVSMMVDPILNATWKTEKESKLGLMKQKADKMSRLLNTQHMKCQPITGAMYAFPQIFLPAKFVQAHENPNLEWCVQLLRTRGVVGVPGNGFLQVAGTYHVSFSVLERAEKMDGLIASITEFHEELWKEWE